VAVSTLESKLGYQQELQATLFLRILGSVLCKRNLFSAGF